MLIHGFWCIVVGFELISNEMAFFVRCESTVTIYFCENAFLGGAILGSLRRICTKMMTFMPFWHLFDGNNGVPNCVRALFGVCAYVN